MGAACFLKTAALAVMAMAYSIFLPVCLRAESVRLGMKSIGPGRSHCPTDGCSGAWAVSVSIAKTTYCC